ALPHLRALGRFVAAVLASARFHEFLPIPRHSPRQLDLIGSSIVNGLPPRQFARKDGALALRSGMVAGTRVPVAPIAAEDYALIRATGNIPCAGGNAGGDAADRTIAQGHLDAIPRRKAIDKRSANVTVATCRASIEGWVILGRLLPAGW